LQGFFCLKKGTGSFFLKAWKKLPVPFLLMS
jgi:hypothetical protein